MRRSFVLSALSGALLSAVAWSFGQAPLGQIPPPVFIKVPGHPFTAVPSSDGQWLFVSLAGGEKSGIAALHRNGAEWTVGRTVPVQAGVSGLALSHDGRTLVATAGDSVAAFDVKALTDGGADPSLGSCPDKGAASVNVVVAADDAYAFVSNEGSATVGVIDLSKARTGGLSPAALVGKIPVGIAPVGLALSPDGKTLYGTSEVAPEAYGWPKQFAPEERPNAKNRRPAGVLAVIDVHLAETDPAHALLRKIPAGNTPVRVALSPDGARVYVTLRGSDTVSAFSAADLTSTPRPAPAWQLTVGPAPVGIALSNDGRFIVTANSNRFVGGDKPQTLSVIDTSKLDAGVVATIPAGSFPREIRLTADGNTLIVTNFDSDTVELVDISSLVKPPR